MCYLRHHIVTLILYYTGKIGAVIIPVGVGIGIVGGGVGGDWTEPNDKTTTTLGNVWIEGNSSFVSNGSCPPAGEHTSSFL